MTERTRNTTRGNSRGGSQYEYKSRSADSMRKRGEQSGTDFDTYIKEGIKLWKPNDGDNIIRALPPTWDNADHYGLDIYVHYGVGSDNQAYLCLDKMLGKPCPICDERNRAQKTGDEDYVKKLKPNKRVLFYLIDRNNEKAGVVAWAAPWTIDRDICKVSVDKRSGEILELDNPNDGYDIEFEKQGKGERTEYMGIAVSRRASPLDNDEALEFIAEHPLPAQLNYYSYEHIAQVFGGASASSAGSEDSTPHKPAGKADEELPSWDDVHSMTFDELCSLCELHALDIKPDDSRDDAELAGWICEDLKISKRAVGDSPNSKLADMRRRRVE